MAWKTLYLFHQGPRYDPGSSSAIPYALLNWQWVVPTRHSIFLYLQFLRDISFPRDGQGLLVEN